MLRRVMPREEEARLLCWEKREKGVVKGEHGGCGSRRGRCIVGREKIGGTFSSKMGCTIGGPPSNCQLCCTSREGDHRRPPCMHKDEHRRWCCSQGLGFEGFVCFVLDQA